MFEPQNDSNRQLVMDSDQSMINQEFEYTSKLPVIRHVRKVISQGSPVQRRVSPRLKYIPESKRPYYRPSRRDLSECSSEQKNQENVNANHSTNDTSPNVSREKDVDKDCERVVDRSETKGLPNCTFQKVRDQGFGSDAAVFNGVACFAAGDNGNIDSKVGNSKWLDGCNSSLNADDKSARAQRRFSPRLKKIPESKRPYYGTSRRDSSQCSNDQNNQENVNANYNTQESSSNVSREKDTGKKRKSEVDHSETIGLPNYSFEKVRDQGSGSDAAIFDGVTCSVAGNNGNIDSKVGNSKWLDVCNSSLDGTSVYAQRRFSPRLKNIPENKRPYYGPFEKVRGQGSGTDAAMFNGVTCFVAGNNENIDSKVGNSKCIHVYNPSPNADRESAYAQRRFSPRLKNITESKRPYYGASQRDSPQFSNDKNNQENVNANHSTQDNSLNVSRDRHVDKEYKKSEVDCSETKGLPNCIFEKVSDQGFGSDAAIIDGFTCSTAGNNGNIDSKVGNSKRLDNCNSSSNADGKSAYVQRRFSPRLKTIPESERPYYGTSQRALSQCSNDKNNQENVNANHSTQESSPNVSRDRDIDKECKSEVDNSETKGLPNCGFEKVWDQVSGSDVAIFNGVMCSAAGSNGHIHSKLENSKWSDDYNSSPNTDGGKGAHARVKQTLINDNRHYLHFVQEKEKRCKKGEVNDRTVAKGLKHKVVRFWPTKGAFGFVAYKYHLRRLERRQPKLTNPQVYFTQARGLKASSKLHGLVSEDISGGQEDVPIPATNLIDDAPVAPTGEPIKTKIEKQNDKTVMPSDARVRHLNDQLIQGRVYLSLTATRNNPHFIRELRLRMKEAQRSLGEATKDSELPRNSVEKLKALEQTLAKGKQIQDDCTAMVKKLRAMLHSTEEQLRVHKKQTLFLTHLTAKTLPKGLHCLPLRLSTEYFSLNSSERNFPNQEKLEDPRLYHYALFTDNILAAAVVVNSTISHAKDPSKHVFHIVTDRLNYAAMRMWFLASPAGKATIQIQNVDEFTWLNSSYSPVLKQLGSPAMIDYYFKTRRADSDSNLKFRNPKYLSIMNHLRFYLPEIYPKLNKVLFLDDDIVVLKDLTGLWSLDLKGKVNGAVETCGETFHRFDRYLNFSNPLISKKFDPHACGWAFGMNIFDLEEWKRQNITEVYHSWQNLNHDRQLWKLGTLPPGLVTFWNRTYSLDRFWHVLGLGYNPNVSPKEIERAAVIHYNGNLKPWLEIGIPKFRSYWAKFVDYDHLYLRECNINP